MKAGCRFVCQILSKIQYEMEDSMRSKHYRGVLPVFLLKVALDLVIGNRLALCSILGRLVLHTQPPKTLIMK